MSKADLSVDLIEEVKEKNKLLIQIKLSEPTWLLKTLKLWINYKRCFLKIIQNLQRCEALPVKSPWR
jgi:hypothetical protein